jgi:hypothetical protein
MRSFLNKFLLLLIPISLAGCIEPFEVDIKKEEKKLVVNGLITNEPGPYTVKLNKTYQYGEYFGEAHPDVLGATVTISDDTGNSETLAESKPGIYRTKDNGIRGVVGRKYTLRIKLKNGQQYVSAAELLQAVPEIKNVSKELVQIHEMDKEGIEVVTNALEIQVDAQDAGAEKNFYRWDWTGTFEIITQPEEFVTTDPRTGLPVKRPKPCCSQCWVTKHNNSINVVEDRLFNGNMLSGHKVAVIPATPLYLASRYHIEIRQYSISEAAYDFWQMVNLQSTGTGSVQDPAPANAVSNLKNVANNDEPIYGFFGASAIVRKQMFIEKKDVPVPVPRLELPDDCRTVPGSTTDRPSFW